MLNVTPAKPEMTFETSPAFTVLGGIGTTRQRGRSSRRSCLAALWKSMSEGSP